MFPSVNDYSCLPYPGIVPHRRHPAKTAGIYTEHRLNLQYILLLNNICMSRKVSQNSRTGISRPAVLTGTAHGTFRSLSPSVPAALYCFYSTRLTLPFTISV